MTKNYFEKRSIRIIRLDRMARRAFSKRLHSLEGSEEVGEVEEEVEAVIKRNKKRKAKEEEHFLSSIVFFFNNAQQRLLDGANKGSLLFFTKHCHWRIH